MDETQDVLKIEDRAPTSVELENKARIECLALKIVETMNAELMRDDDGARNADNTLWALVHSTAIFIADKAKDWDEGADVFCGRLKWLLELRKKAGEGAKDL